MAVFKFKSGGKEHKDYNDAPKKKHKLDNYTREPEDFQIPTIGEEKIPVQANYDYQIKLQDGTVKNMYFSDDTPMDNPDLRGAIPFNDGVEYRLPADLGVGVIGGERLNNAVLIDAIMAIEDKLNYEKAKIDIDASIKKSSLELQARKLEIETIAEYNTQAAAHRLDGLVEMCHIVIADKEK